MPTWIASDWGYAGLGALAAVVLIIVWRVWAALSRTRKRRRQNQAYARRWTKSYSEYEAAHAKALAQLSRDWNVIEIVHDLADYPLAAAGPPEHISFEEAFDVVRRIRASTGDLAIVLHTLGGVAMPTEMIAMALKQHTGRKVAFVPYAAMSGGTVIALATQQVCMGDTAVLGPIDTQIAGWSADNFAYLRDQKAPDAIRDEALMASHRMTEVRANEIERTQRWIDGAHGASVADALIAKGRPHDEMITRDEAQGLQINIGPSPFPAAVYDLVDARLQMTAKIREDVYRRRVGVEV